jgi:hypothetical protein
MPADVNDRTHSEEGFDVATPELGPLKSGRDPVEVDSGAVIPTLS